MFFLLFFKTNEFINDYHENRSRKNMSKDFIDLKENKKHKV